MALSFSAFRSSLLSSDTRNPRVVVDRSLRSVISNIASGNRGDEGPEADLANGRTRTDGGGSGEIPSNLVNRKRVR